MLAGNGSAMGSGGLRATFYQGTHKVEA